MAEDLSLRVGIVGLGLIGGSLAKAFREYTDCTVCGFDRDPAVVQAVLEQSARRAGGSFGTECNRTAALVLKGVHLLLHHVGFRADAAAEKVGVFHERSAKFAKTVAGKHLAGSGFHHLKKTALRRKLVGKALDSLNLCHERTPAK